MVNRYVTLGCVESYGVREIDVKEDYGFDSVQQLANYIYDQIHNDLATGLKNDAQTQREKELKRKLLKMRDMIAKRYISVKEYFIGFFHSIPIFIQVAAIVLFGISLWGYIRFNEVQATSVILGVILGFVVSAGFIQVLGRQVSFFWYRKNWVLAKVSVIHMMKTFLKTMTTLALIGIIGNLILPLFPTRFLIIIFLYGFLIGFLLLNLAPLYTIKYRWVISAIITLGTCTTILMFKYLDWSIYLIHALNIFMCIILSLIATELIYRKITATSNDENTEVTPAMLMSIYGNLNYFLYGTLVFVFVFLDRILAWSSPKQHDLPFVIYYQQEYEVGMDLAIIVFFMLAGTLEYAISSFTRFLDYKQQVLNVQDSQKFKNEVKSLYFKHVIVLGLSTIISSLFIYFIITQPWGYQWAFHEPLSQISLMVCVLGGFGYLFLSVGLLNVLYLFTLNRHQSSVFNIGIALIVNLVVGVICSRLISYEYSVVGMLVGSLIFMILTTASVLRFFRHIEYHYYAVY